MLIILDTNILQEDWRLSGGRIKVLLEYSAKSGAGFVLPKIVYEEVLANYRREHADRVRNLIRASEQIAGMEVTPVAPPTHSPTDRATEQFRAHLLAMLDADFRSVATYPAGALEDAIGRATDRRPPCTERGEEIRDAVLWSSVLAAAREHNDVVSFISRNVKQFSENKKDLHPVLAAEASTLGLAIEYFASLEEFARRHAEPIAFVTAEWIEEMIASDDVVEAIHDQLIEAAYEAAYERSGRTEEVEGGFFIASGGVSVDEFFVNAVGDGILRIEASWYGHPTVEYEVRESFDSYGAWNRSHGDYLPLSSREVELRAAVKTQLLVKEGALLSWSVIESSVLR
jgi:hypothetical protein